MRIVGKFLAIAVMGAICLALIAFPVSFPITVASAGGEPPFVAILAPFAIVAALVIYLALAAPTARIAWGRLCVLAGLGGFALPFAGLAASWATNSLVMAQAAGRLTPEAHAGATIGMGLATAAISGIAAFLGFFLGLIFIVAAYFTLRGARRPLRA